MIDFYGFVGPWPYWECAHSSPEKVLSLMQRHNIERLAICSTRSIFWDWREGNEEALSLADRFRGKFLPFVCVSPILPAAELKHYILRCKERNAKGIRLYPQQQSYTLTSISSVTAIFDAAQEAGFPVVLPIRVVMNWGLPELDPSSIETVVARYPGVRFVLSGVNYDHTLWAYDFLKRCPNVSIEISALQGFRSLDQAVENVGVERVLFGSGLPVLYPACSIAKLSTAKMSAAAKQAVAEGNAVRILGMTS